MTAGALLELPVLCTATAGAVVELPVLCTATAEDLVELPVLCLAIAVDLELPVLELEAPVKDNGCVFGTKLEVGSTRGWVSEVPAATTLESNA